MTDVVEEPTLRNQMTLDDETLAAIEDGFARLAAGEVTIPPIMGLEMPDKNGAADVKAAYVRGWDGFAVKLSTRFFDNPQRGLASGSGLIALLDADTGHKNEIDPTVWREADVAVCDLRAQCRERGELRHVLATGALSNEDDVLELGDVVTGRAAGRSGDEQISLCDLTGVGVQDTAIARVAWQRTRTD